MHKPLLTFVIFLALAMCIGCTESTISSNTDGDIDNMDGDTSGENNLPDGDLDKTDPDGDSEAETSDADDETLTDGDTDTSETGENNTSPDLYITPQQIDIVEYEDCCSTERTITITNNRNTDITINRITFPVNRIVQIKLPDLEEYPLIIDANSTFYLKVQACGISAGAIDEDLTMVSDAEQAPIIKINFKGEIKEFPTITDTFHTPAKQKLDILFVVDCSGSMAEKHSTLKDSFSDFFENSFNYDTTDVNVAITSCDVLDENHSGKFQGTPHTVLHSEFLSPSQLRYYFKQTIDGLGTECDSTKEAGFDAAILALSEPLISGHNSGFLRDDSKLVIIFVSDEDDMSDKYAEASLYVDYLKNIKGMANKNMLEIYAIVGDSPDGCSGDNGDAAAGTRYIELAASCNVDDEASFLSICEDDYSEIFNFFSDTLFSLKNQFFLTSLPNPETLAVTVNTIEMENWTYDGDSNSIVFDTPVKADSTIIVTYKQFMSCNWNKDDN